jgi:hypothetical protein
MAHFRNCRPILDLLSLALAEMLTGALSAGKAATNANKVNRIDLDVRQSALTSDLVSFLSFKFTSLKSVAGTRFTGHA